jgi:hypothetical protein
MLVRLHDLFASWHGWTLRQPSQQTRTKLIPAHLHVVGRCAPPACCTRAVGSACPLAQRSCSTARGPPRALQWTVAGSRRDGERSLRPVQVRNGRQGVYFKERMRRGETIVSFPRNLRLDEKTAMKGKAGHIFQRLKTEKAYPDLMVILHIVHERSLGKVCLACPSAAYSEGKCFERYARGGGGWAVGPREESPEGGEWDAPRTGVLTASTYSDHKPGFVLAPLHQAAAGQLQQHHAPH